MNRQSRNRSPVTTAVSPVRPPSAIPAELSTKVVFDDAASSNATVIEVRATTKIGILHRITKALGELGLDIRHATVQSIGMDVVDTFYVQGRNGRLIDDAFHRAEIERAVLHAVS